MPDEDRCLRQVVNGFFTVYSVSLLPPRRPRSCILITSECELSPAAITVTTPAKALMKEQIDSAAPITPL